MAHLHVKTPNGTAYSIDLDAVSQVGSIPSSGNNGWGVLTNGGILQWGTKSYSDTGAICTVTFPTTFSNSVYAVFINMLWLYSVDVGIATGYLIPYYDNESKITKSGFSTYYHNKEMCWMAIGI